VVIEAGMPEAPNRGKPLKLMHVRLAGYRKRWVSGAAELLPLLPLSCSILDHLSKKPSTSTCPPSQELKMRLLTTNLTFEEFFDSNVPPYAILSHRWGNARDEVSFRDMETGTATGKLGLKKIEECARLTEEHQLGYFWIDTCCIDKNSSAELSEAINSMYRWYQNATVCFVYLNDVVVDRNGEVNEEQFRLSQYWRRGWTLQELIAPKNVAFFSKEWMQFGTKLGLKYLISAITSVDSAALDGTWALKSFSISCRMSWAAKRETTRSEDIAYCLLGIFDVNMPLLYGEGKKAFIRLQEEIMKASDDHTLFSWTKPTGMGREMCGLLADSPAQFEAAGDYLPVRPAQSMPYSMTNKGLSITLFVFNILAKDRDGPDHEVIACDARIADPQYTVAALEVFCRRSPGSEKHDYKAHIRDSRKTPLIYLTPVVGSPDHYARHHVNRIDLIDKLPATWGQLRSIFIRADSLDYLPSISSVLELKYTPHAIPTAPPTTIRCSNGTSVRFTSVTSGQTL
jgi:hypothetical protein